jgi:hypothetical protein
VDAAQLAQLVLVLGGACSVTYWGGQLHANVKRLASIALDHEGRMRELEQPED